jgi:hypothetical protein
MGHVITGTNNRIDTRWLDGFSRFPLITIVDLDYVTVIGIPEEIYEDRLIYPGMPLDKFNEIIKEDLGPCGPDEDVFVLRVGSDESTVELIKIFGDRQFAVVKNESNLGTRFTIYAEDDVTLMHDGYHSVKELYEYRKLYNALLFNAWARLPGNPHNVHKSYRHDDGEPCFGGGWFIVKADTPFGQISNHYKDPDWLLFDIPERERASKYDGHTPQDVLVTMGKLLANKPQG